MVHSPTFSTTEGHIMKALRTGFAGLLLAFMVSMGMVVTTAQPTAALSLPKLDLGPIDDVGKLFQKVGHTISSNGVVRSVGTAARLPTNPVGIALTVGTGAWMVYDNRDALINVIQPRNGDSLWTMAGLAQQFDPGHPMSDGGATAHPHGWGPVGQENLRVEISQVSPTTLEVRVECVVSRVINGDERCGPSGSSGPQSFASRTSTGDLAGYEGMNVASCQTATGSRVIREVTASRGFIVSFGRYDGLAPDPWVETIQTQPCDPGETVVGYQVPPKVGPGFQKFGMAWGDMLTDPFNGWQNLPVQFRDARVTVDCKNMVTGDTRQIELTSAWGSSETVVMPSCKQHLGDDWVATGFTIAPEKPEVETAPGEWEPLPEEWDVPDFPPSEWDELIPNEGDADWQPCHGTKNGCSLGVWIDDNPCTPGGVCTKWTEVQVMNPDRVKCRYGNIWVGMAACMGLANAYQTGVDTSTGVNPWPDTGTGTGTNTGTGTGPGTGTGTNTTPTQVTNPSTGAGTSTDNCMGAMASWNPVNWVFTPVKCALEWAFVPKTSVAERLDRMGGVLSTKAPFSWYSSLLGLPGAIGGGSCPDWSFSFGGFGTGNSSHVVLCDTAMGNAVRGLRPVITVIVLGAAVIPLVRSLLYAGTPIVKPTPT